MCRKPAFSADKQKHQAAIAEEREKERSLLVKQLQEDQTSLKAYLQDHPLANQTFEARQQGIVICAGGNKLLINAYVSLKVMPCITTQDLFQCR